ncbi:hypothetical protein KR018_009929, partial [Drosophila ironensis]
SALPLQFEDRFRSRRLNNWEYPRFAPPRPRKIQLGRKILAGPDGHLLPDARRDGNSFGRFRGTYELPRKITRGFCQHYDDCLSSRYKFRNFPRDLCSCQRENQRALACDNRVTLGCCSDPRWKKPKCQTKCEGLQLLKDLHETSVRCKRAKCDVVSERNVKCPPRIKAKTGQVSTEHRRRRKRTITAFARSRSAIIVTEAAVAIAAEKLKEKKDSKDIKEIKETKEPKEPKENKENKAKPKKSKAKDKH